VQHGFLRARDGAFTTFDPQGSILTIPASINPAGVITGYWSATGHFGAHHGFLRSRDGTVSSFDPPGSIFTFPASINPAGTITGYYGDANFVTHGFLRSPNHKEKESQQGAEAQK
jgi:hypothetical protein